MTSTYDLISHIPGYMVEILSARILGRPVDVTSLAEGLSDETRLKKVIEELSERQRTLLMDLHELGGSVQWDVLTSIYRHSLDPLKEDLMVMGGKGIVFQGGLSGRDPIILLPSLSPILEEMRQLFFARLEEHSWVRLSPMSIWGHIALLNTLKASSIRCRSGMEPFKRGWEFLEERLSGMIEVERIYWELVELGCIREKKGVLCVSGQASIDFATEGDDRYALWRFIRSCRGYPGLEHKVFTVIQDKAVRRDLLIRSLVLFLYSRNPEEVYAQEMVSSLIDGWIHLGILQRDESGIWLCFSEPAYRSLKSGKPETSPHPYCEDMVIQPNMEILAPRDFDPVDLLDLGEIADLVQTDVLSLYRVTKKSVSRGLRDGWNSEKIRVFLERISRHELPDNLRKTIQGWANERPEAHIIRGTFLVLSGADCKASRGLTEVLPGIYRVPENCEEEIAVLLDKGDVIVHGADSEKDAEDGVSWGKLLPFQFVPKAAWKESRKEGVFPFGMVSPLPYGTKGEGVFEKALHDGEPIVIFYPRQGYGEIEVKKISPIYIYRKGGIPFVEAFCEDTGEGEVFDITKVRALLKNA
jgi:hypothetical protein